MYPSLSPQTTITYDKWQFKGLLDRVQDDNEPGAAISTSVAETVVGSQIPLEDEFMRSWEQYVAPGVDLVTLEGFTAFHKKRLDAKLAASAGKPKETKTLATEEDQRRLEAYKAAIPFPREKTFLEDDTFVTTTRSRDEQKKKPSNTPVKEALENLAAHGDERIEANRERLNAAVRKEADAKGSEVLELNGWCYFGMPKVYSPSREICRDRHTLSSSREGDKDYEKLQKEYDKIVDVMFREALREAAEEPQAPAPVFPDDAPHVNPHVAKSIADAVMNASLETPLEDPKSPLAHSDFEQ
jgi:hypothetical protein